MTRSGEPAAGEGRPSCEYCGFAAAKLYAVASIRRTDEPAELAVCHFCYLRLRGIRPNRSVLVDPARRTVPLA